MSNRLSDAMSKLTVDSARNSLARPSAGANVKRQSGLDPSTINAMFPDAAAAIATEKAKFTQQTGNPPTSARNSMVDPRSSLAAPTISAPKDDPNGQNPTSPWGPNDPSRPKSSSGQPPMGQFVQPPPSGGGLRSPRPQISGNTNIQSTTLTTGEQLADLPLLSPYGASGNWASMVNTPMVPTFNQPQGNNADMVANATAMKLAALSTVNNRFALDDVRKYRRARSNDAPGQQTILSPGAPGIPGAIMVSEHGMPLTREQMIALQQRRVGGILRRLGRAPPAARRPATHHVRVIRVVPFVMAAQTHLERAEVHGGQSAVHKRRPSIVGAQEAVVLRRGEGQRGAVVLHRDAGRVGPRPVRREAQVLRLLQRHHLLPAQRHPVLANHDRAGDRGRAG